jgi:aminoglycoside 6'-N-acetyltransferase I
LRAALWPESSTEEHARELRLILAGRFPRVMPLVILVAEASHGTVVGFLEAGLRSCADGCDETHPVGYMEGWYVRENCRQQGIGAELLKEAENWARSQGCIEMASDAAIDNAVSQRAHESLGFEVVERSVLYRKTL